VEWDTIPTLNQFVALFIHLFRSENVRSVDYNLPIMRLINAVKRRQEQPASRPDEPKKQEENTYGSPALHKRVIQTYFANKKTSEGVSLAYQVTPVFVIQPIPFYKYDLRYHIAYKEVLDRRLVNNCDLKCYAWYGYPVLASELKRNDTTNLLWLADMQEGQRKPLYVDTVHYTADMSSQIATQLSSYLQDRQLLTH
jgi:hypothetical protein